MTIVATSYMVKMALDVAGVLQTKGISAEIVDLRTLEPLDIDTVIKSVNKTKRAVVVDEDVSRCGVAAEICMQIMEKLSGLSTSHIQRVAAANFPTPAGYLEDYALPQPQDIANAIARVLDMKEPLLIPKQEQQKKKGTVSQAY